MKSGQTGMNREDVNRPEHFSFSVFAIAQLDSQGCKFLSGYFNEDFANAS
ncbi:hypothetical protein Hanom_Chr14g01307121 [Helianthus anomalus]